MNSKNQPVFRSERLLSIDVLRGFALLGILVMNIQAFAMTGSAYSNPYVYGDLSGINYWVWVLSHVLFDSKMMAIFSMLFGAGIVLMFEKSKSQSGRSAWLHYRRMFWLILFGLAHAHLIWYGDILFAYGMCGVWVYWAKKWKPKWLFLAGVLMLTIPSAIYLVTDLSLPHMDKASYQELKADWIPSQEMIDEDLETYRGSWLTQLPKRSHTALVFETFLLAILFFWRAGGLMLIGMGLFKLRILDASQSRSFYWRLSLASLLPGLALVIYGIVFNFRTGWQFDTSMFEAVQFNYWGSILVAIGYVCLVMLFFKSSIGGWLKTSLQAVGQMALTNYLMQSAICTLLFYGHGLGWYGHLSRFEQLLVVLAVWTFQMILSPIWLSRFRYGPFEWLWRSLSYMQLQPIVRKPN